MTRCLRIAMLVVLLLHPTFSLVAEPGPVDTGKTARMLISTAQVLLMVPGLAMFQGKFATIALAAAGTFVICVIVEKSVGFRIDEQFEFDGLDKSLQSENGYGLIFPESR